MAISPGIYALHCYVDESLVLGYIPQDGQVRGTRILSLQDCNQLNLQWRLELYVIDGWEYLIQNVQTQQYLSIQEGKACLRSWGDATIWDLRSVESGVGFIKQSWLTQVLSLGQKSGDLTFYARVTDNDDTHRGRLWSFRKRSDIVDEQPHPSPPVPQPQDSPPSTSVGPNESIPKDSNGPSYVDDTHLYTDTLFNDPHTPLTRTQRMAALEWARRMGATDIPTMESFDECERALEAQGGSNSQPSAPRDTTDPYGDDAHFHIDMLFNMPRTPFTRAQRAMTLEWLRRLGVPNVPTMKSFDTCERALNGGQSGGNNAGQGLRGLNHYHTFLQWMPISPGIYILQAWYDESLVLDYNTQTQALEGIQAVWPRDSKKLTLQWRVELSRDSFYVLQNLEAQKYLTYGSGTPFLVLREHAIVWELSSIKSGRVGQIKPARLNPVMSVPQQSGNPRYSVRMATPSNPTDHLWCFKPLSELIDEQPDPTPQVPQPQDSPPNSRARPNKIIPKSSNHPYTDDIFFRTDVLFNMPRTPLTRTQRMAALEWARKMGAIDVPTMESFDECERTLEATQSGLSSQAPTPKDTTTPYGDDAHFHTDMLFNMPRTPFTRTQRVLALEWVRNLGATNVPTMESFDECERILGGGQSGGNNVGRG